MPKRVAVISSSGVNNDYRSWGEYDGTLQGMGWVYDKFRNTEIEKFFKRMEDYDLVLTTSLWNYGDPVDMKKYIPLWREYFAKGGIVILTDMAYPPMCDWLSSFDPELFIQYGDANREIGELASLDLSHTSSFLLNPNKIGAFNYWAHFPHWGGKYRVWARTKGGTAIGLYAFVEKGILIVTTGWAFSAPMLENLYVNALMLKSGIDVGWQKAPSVTSPGSLDCELALRNLRDKEIHLSIEATIKGEREEIISRSGSREISLSPREEKTISFSLSCDKRGEFFLVARYKTNEMEGFQEVVHKFRVPPLIEAELNRSIFARSDVMSITVRTAPKIGERTICQLEIVDGKDKTTWRKRMEMGGEEILNLSLARFAPGSYRLRIMAESNSERASEELGFKVAREYSPPTVTKVGSKGELLLQGKPFFPLGTYHIGVEDFPKAREMGFNCVTSPIYGPQQRELTPDQLNWHDLAYKAGLWVITELSEYIRGGRSNFAEAKDIISQLRLHPATIAHYVIDEPLGGGISSEKVREFTSLVKKVDPEHITFVNEVPGAVSGYAGIGDITGTDPYPIGAETPKSLAGVSEAVDSAVKASKGKPVWAVIQAHRQPPPNSNNRYPTPEEIRCMSYLALNHGARGILFYAWGDVYQTEIGIWESGFKFEPKLMDYFPRLLKELKEIGIEYLLGSVERISSVEPSELDAVVVTYKGKRKLVVVNPTSKELSGRINVSGNQIVHFFAPFEVFLKNLDNK
ncbi:hypothetical protein H5T87_08450 [bacterium]|nr:hypothetical protein [bacterium]